MKKNYLLVIKLHLVLFLLVAGFLIVGTIASASDVCAIKEVMVVQQELCGGNQTNFVKVKLDFDTNLIEYVKLFNDKEEYIVYPHYFHFSNAKEFYIHDIPFQLIDNINILIADINNQEYRFPLKSTVYDNQLRTSAYYDGEWSGKTTQGHDVSFTVSGNNVSSFKIKYDTSWGSYCTSIWTITIGTIDIIGNHFEKFGSILL